MQSTGAGVTSRRARMEPQTRFCTTTDGVRIAFGATGDGSAPGILVPSLLSPTRLLAHDPAYRELAARESAALRRRMIFFDRRGTGLSERDVDDFRPEVLVRDVEAVVDHLDLQPALIMGIDTACAVAVEYAVRHPERVSHLVLFAPFRRGCDLGTAEGRDLVMSSLRSVETIGAELMSVFAMPGVGPEIAKRYAKVLRESCSGRAAAAQVAATYAEDLTEYLPRVAVPTLILHPRGSRLIPLELGREVASLIPNARFLALDYETHVVWTQDPTPYIDAMAEFVGEQPGERPRARSAHGTAIILFADIVDSTGLTERLGDEHFRTRARALDGALRAAIRDASGTPRRGQAPRRRRAGGVRLGARGARGRRALPRRRRAVGPGVARRGARGRRDPRGRQRLRRRRQRRLAHRRGVRTERGAGLGHGAQPRADVGGRVVHRSWRAPAARRLRARTPVGRVRRAGRLVGDQALGRADAEEAVDRQRTGAAAADGVIQPRPLALDHVGQLIRVAAAGHQAHERGACVEVAP